MATYTIRTAQEYEAAQNLIEKYQALIMSKRLLGEETASLELKVMALDEVLSTESAINVAEKMELDAVAAARAKAAAATTEETAAVRANTVAHGLNALQMRESMVIMREMMLGNVTRLGSSLSILMGASGFGGLAMVGIPVLFAIMEGFKQWSENAKKASEAMSALTNEHYNNAEAALKMEEVWQKAKESHDEYLESLKQHVADQDDPSKEPMARASKAVSAWRTAQEQINDAQKRLGEAAIDELEKRGLVTHEQALKAKLVLDEQYEQRRLQLDAQADAMELGIKQKTADIVGVQKKNAETAESAAEAKAAASAASRQKTETEIAKIKEDQKIATEMMQKSGISKEQADSIRELYENIFNLPSTGPGAASLTDQAQALKNALANTALGVGPNMTLSQLNSLRSLFSPVIGAGLTQEQIAVFQGGEDLANKTNTALGDLNRLLAQKDADDKRAQAELERQKHLLDEKTVQLDKLQQEIDELKATQQAKQANAATVAGIQAQAQGVKSGAAIPPNAFGAPPAAAAAPAPMPAMPPTNLDNQVQAMIDAFTTGHSANAYAIANALQRSMGLSNEAVLRLIGLIEETVQQHAFNSVRIGYIESQVFGSRNAHASG